MGSFDKFDFFPASKVNPKTQFALGERFLGNQEAPQKKKKKQKSKKSKKSKKKIKVNSIKIN